MNAVIGITKLDIAVLGVLAFVFLVGLYAIIRWVCYRING